MWIQIHNQRDHCCLIQPELPKEKGSRTSKRCLDWISNRRYSRMGEKNTKQPMKITLILLAMSLCACSSMHKETYTETREFHYPKGATPHLKDMYMHKGPEVRKAEPVIHQEFNHDITGTGDVPMNTEVSLQDVSRK